MDYSVLITRFLGVVFTVYGLGMLFNRSNIKIAFDDASHNKTISFIVGVNQLFWGSFFVVAQQVWTNWSVMTTLAGWFIFLMGVSRVLMPGCSSKCKSKSGCGGMLAFIGFVVFAWGVLMMFYGFFGNLENMTAAFHGMTSGAMNSGN